ncbi:Putative amino-acid ABC transporter-binding protein YhdW [Granulosicoccus antarcticus IMCC3135]|uniref:Amino-acid ABC transporter-binding protein YhdW n=2 Tax=Granulosicoccus TaxID=437504 RepID=A0A2Z2NSX4_9GAMM|nr:Putative amino-acid ABC transporter-binding protein YhdW [Granulosicoccus antarcticus IMCC3135]
MLSRKRLLLPALLALISGNSTSAATLETALDRGALRCGVNAELAGFAKANSLGEYSGFDIDICRAVASAVFNDSEAVEMIPVTTTDRFPAMLSGTFDILSRNTTWTLERNAQFGQFAGVNFYDGQGFMVTKSSGIRSALELDNQPICVGRNTTSVPNAEDFFAVSDIRYRPVFFNDEVEAAEGYKEGRCKALTADRSALAAHRTGFPESDAHMVLPEVISKEPLGPMVPQDDSRWENIVRWSLNCMINAEELGVTSSNVNDPATANTPAIQRLIGAVDNMGELLGLNKQWCSRIIQQVGNYGEVYDRHLGPDTPLGLERGINELWTNGGLIYAPPVR